MVHLVAHVWSGVNKGAYQHRGRAAMLTGRAGGPLCDGRWQQRQGQCDSTKLSATWKSWGREGGSCRKRNSEVAETNTQVNLVQLETIDLPTSTLSQRKGRAPQPSITFSCQAGGGGGGGPVVGWWGGALPRRRRRDSIRSIRLTVALGKRKPIVLTFLKHLSNWRRFLNSHVWVHWRKRRPWITRAWILLGCRQPPVWEPVSSCQVSMENWFRIRCLRRRMPDIRLPHFTTPSEKLTPKFISFVLHVFKRKLLQHLFASFLSTVNKTIFSVCFHGTLTPCEALLVFSTCKWPFGVINTAILFYLSVIVLWPRNYVLDLELKAVLHVQCLWLLSPFSTNRPSSSWMRFQTSKKAHSSDVYNCGLFWTTVSHKSVISAHSTQWLAFRLPTVPGKGTCRVFLK